MTPEREFLLEQAAACRQLAMIAEPDNADNLRALATQYEMLAEPTAAAERSVQNALADLV